jgi:serine/threonine protein kinase/tetratricopeptide (TPR) repeat protein
MANSPPDSSASAFVPSDPAVPLVSKSQMPPRELPPEVWERIQDLFQKMIESPNPLEVSANETDATVKSGAERLYRDHRRASTEGFLDQPLMVVRDLSFDPPERFASGQLLASRFAVQRLLGAGGMGEVYLAHDNWLQERVAIKTIRGILAADFAVRRRFFAEIQNARRVTHPNVCRIFDLFEDGEIPFFAMEYVDGISLADWMLQDAHPRVLRRRVALRLAEGLDAAHRSAIVHCDFKPANVIVIEQGDPRPVITDFGLARALSESHVGTAAPSLQAGTFDYMAPELRAGGQPTVRSDIYAFGKVLEQLLPEERISAACVASAAADRPASLQPVIQRLRGGKSRRLWLLAAAAAPFAGLAGYEWINPPRIVILGRQRIVFNAFRPPDSGEASLLRELVITAVRQSLVVTVVPDERIRSMLHKASFAATLPADTRQLMTVAGQDGIALIVEGNIRAAQRTVQLVLDVFRPGEPAPALTITRRAADRSGIVSMVDQVVLQLRREFGESRAALTSANVVPLAQITSADPNALECYFRGVQLYENAEAEAAIEWFRKATEVDSQFALAWIFLALARTARFQLLTARPAYERAFSLRHRVSQREQLWIEFQYFNFISDNHSSLESARKLVALYSDDATYQRNVAFQYAYVGRPEDALPYNERAVQLDPNDNNVSEWIINTAEANRCDEALALFDRFRSQGYESTLLDRGVAAAWLGKGELEKAQQAYEHMGSDARRERWARLMACGPEILAGRFSETAATLEGDLAWDIATREENNSHMRRVWLGNLEWLLGAPARARYQVQQLLLLPPQPAVMDVLREAALLAHSIGEPQLATQALAKLTEIAATWPSTRTRGIRAHIEGALFGNSEEAGPLLNEAIGLWPDPYTVYSQAQWLDGRDDDRALKAYIELDRQRGRILVLKRYFPGLLVLGWIGQARCLVRMSRITDSLRIYERVEQFWLRGTARGWFLEQVRVEIEQVRTRR